MKVIADMGRLQLTAYKAIALLADYYLYSKVAKHPHVWAKLHNEVLELDGRMPDYETLRSMRYLKFVLNEGRIAHPYCNCSPYP